MAKMASSTEHKIEAFAEDLGRVLGTARAKADSWLGQRQAILKQLTQLRDEASTLLNQLGHQAAAVGHRGRRVADAFSEGYQKRRPGRPKGSGRKKRTMSAKARAAISRAQKARWAKQRAAQGTK
jgi:hypothetical protein